MRGIVVAIGLFAQLGPGTIGASSDQPVKMATPTVTNTEGKKLPATKVQRYLKRDAMKYRYCYEKRLLVEPALRGTLTLAFHVLPDGTVNQVRVEGVDNEIENCGAAILRRMQLPKQTEELVVRTKVTLKPPKPVTLPGDCRGPLGCGGHGL
jgi:hypothetical protein